MVLRRHDFLERSWAGGVVAGEWVVRQPTTTTMVAKTSMSPISVAISYIEIMETEHLRYRQDVPHRTIYGWSTGSTLGSAEQGMAECLYVANYADFDF